MNMNNKNKEEYMENLLFKIIALGMIIGYGIIGGLTCLLFLASLPRTLPNVLLGVFVVSLYFLILWILYTMKDFFYGGN